MTKINRSRGGGTDDSSLPTLAVDCIEDLENGEEAENDDEDEEVVSKE